MKITDIESFSVRVPIPQEEAAKGKIHHFGIVRISTDEGIQGYGFRGIDANTLENTVKPALIGQDPFAIERHLEAGLIDWPMVEHALWDLIGKAVGQPVYKLLGGYKDKVKAYLTCVWQGKADQSDQPYQRQAEHAAYFQQNGFKAIKIRAWRPNPLDDVDAVKMIRERVGGKDKLEIMIDRTANGPGWVWDYDTAYLMANKLYEQDVTWLEEPLDRKDLDGLTRLTAATKIPITGGEAERGTQIFREFLVGKCFDIVQPDAIGAGGIFTIRKISAIAESFGIPCILHGSHSLGLAAPLQIIGALPNCPWMEIAIVTPPLLPWEQWEPVNAILKNPPLYEIEDGYIKIPQKPGLGVELNEDALKEYLV
ncbi:TPA: mandelate racemase/muconate lactonizing enzyme family protein [Candidatus Poribacteria bacterium]|nr:mandelate racemase/muconate lactonizing enzyme family protein [Candidatus Poribacteria bacterium]